MFNGIIISYHLDVLLLLWGLSFVFQFSPTTNKPIMNHLDSDSCTCLIFSLKINFPS